MKTQILNDHELVVTPENLTELYAIKKFVEQNGFASLKNVIVVDDESLCQDENFE
jgi:hypothetical protein